MDSLYRLPWTIATTKTEARYWIVPRGTRGQAPRPPRVAHAESPTGVAATTQRPDAALRRQTGDRNYDYLDFYLGTIRLSQRAELIPVYEMIFRRLKERLLNWRYRFPKLSLVEIE